MLHYQQILRKDINLVDISKITPRSDVAFKMIFTEPKHERLLVHFLNCAIEAKDPIKSAKILNSEITKRHVTQKGSRLDIRAETNSGEIVDIELQVGRDEHMVGRALFYWSELFAGSLIVGDHYGKLRRTISINILNFKLFHKDERYWRKCHITDDETNERITDLLEIQFLELDKLKKFTKESPITFWIEFFKNPYSEECQELYKFVPELKEAKEVFEAAKADPEKRRLIEEREEAIRNYAAAMAQSKEEGIEEGEKIGIEKGEKIGIEKGEKRKAIETAKKMLKKGLKVNDIVDFTGLSIAEIDALK